MQIDHFQKIYLDGINLHQHGDTLLIDTLFPGRTGLEIKNYTILMYYSPSLAQQIIISHVHLEKE